MTENYVQKTKYKYDLNSNLVIQGGHRGGDRGPGGGGPNNESNEPSGEADTLVGKRIAQFGDLVKREKPPQGQGAKGKKKEEEKKTKKKAGDIVDPKKNTRFDVSNEANVLTVSLQEGDLLYRPRTKETRGIYEQFLSLLARHLGDLSLSDLKSAGDEILAIMKTEDLTDAARKRECEAITDRMTDESFNQLTVLVGSLVDYDVTGEEYRGEQREEVIDVNVELEESEEESDEDRMVVAGEDQEDGAERPEEQVEMVLMDDEQDGSEELQSPVKKTYEGIVLIQEVDAQWLNRALIEQFPDKMAEEVLEFESKVLKVLALENPRECEKKLFGILGVDKFELIKLLVRNKASIFWGTQLFKAQSQGEKDQLIQSMEVSKEGRELIEQMQSGKKTLLEEVDQLTKKYKQPSAEDMTAMLGKRVTEEILQGTSKTQKILDFDHLQFQQGARLMANKKCLLPKGSQRITKTGYEEIYVPAVRHKFKDDPDNRLIPISEIPDWARPAFPAPITNLNYIQSRVYKSAFQSNENMLICAPTGAGKTNIALLTIMQVLGTKRKVNGRFDIKNFKIVYIAPMKALVTEIVGNFQKRLSDFGITVRELTGDIHLTKSQIEETQVIVTTPEKWDIITRKSGDRAYLELVKLIIIDEIHLLHDLRGPVLEALVARTIRQIESTSEMIRLVALSATLPNYQDVAAFLRVNPHSGLFHFDNSFRPVPLEQIYVGVSEKKAIKRLMLMNEICYEKVIERAGKHQILVFVHSRKETARTAKIIRDMALAKDELHKFIGEHSETREILQSESQTALSQDLKDLLPYGLGIHHAGLARKDRLMVEQLFAAGHLQVLVSTATLAWGVNLPAHTVIIKGTQIYSPEQGKWVELSPQDMLQMMGRAGRPQFDTLGEGIIITNHSELQYHLSLNNQQLPIESQLVTQLADQLNAEVVLGTVSNVKEAVNWLAYTYLYVRMIRMPSLYGIDEDQIATDSHLVLHRADLVHTAAMLLSKAGMIKYDRRTGALQPNVIGKVASHYYIKHNSMSVYNENMKPQMNIIDVFRLFALSKEFHFIPIRENEKIELTKLIDKVPVPVKGALDETATKINVLLQAYISRFKLEGYDLNADMVYVTQSAGRIFRCLFEIAIKRGWAQMSEILLNTCKMVERRQWSSMTPLRQYQGLPEEILRKIEKKEQFTWSHFYDMSAQQIGEIVKFPKMGKIIHKLVHQFPRLELEAYVQPITRSVIRVELAITPDFQWDAKIHGRAEPFWVMVQDSDSEQILHVEQFILKDKYVSEQHVLSFIVSLYDPLPPQYFIKVISDRWLQCETVLPVSFKHLILPERFAPPTELQDMHSKLVKELSFPEAERLYLEEDGIKEFNPIVTQVFNKLYLSSESLFIGAPNGGQDTRTLAELAIWQEVQSEGFDKIVYICPVDSMCKQRASQWKQRLGSQSEVGLNVDSLTGNLQQDLAILNKADLIITTAERWDMMSRKWRQRKVIQRVGLYILDQLQILDATYEVVASRIRFMQNEVERKIRIVALSTPLANAKDVANWLGISFPSNTFNFHPSVRPTPLEIHIQGFDHNNKAVRILAMHRPAYNAIKKALPLTGSRESQALVFVGDRKQARLTALDFLTFVQSEASRDDQRRFTNISQATKEENRYLDSVLSKISEVTVRTTLEHGIGILHDGMSDQEISFMKRIYQDGSIRLLIVVYTLSWSIDDLQSHLVVILDAERFDGQEHKSIEYSIPDMLQMMGRANLTVKVGSSSSSQARCILYCHTPKKEYFIKFLQEPLPIESQLDHSLQDHLNADVVAGTIESKQDAVDWITWTFMYRRIAQNPNYYNLPGRTGQHINDFLSELIENTVEDLVKAKCLQTKGEDEMELEPANLGRIASFYYIKYQTIENFSKNLEDESTLGKKMKFLLEILAKSSEFQNIPIRQGEASLLQSLVPYLTYPLEEAEGQDVLYNRPDSKTNILLQCHFNRTPLGPDLRIDQRFILENSIKLVHAMVDVISSHGYLKPALLTMELSQMIVQAMWVTQSPLYQLPYIDGDLVSDLKKAKVEDIIDFMNMDEELRAKVLRGISESQMGQIADVCNRYPTVEMEFSLDFKQYKDGDTAEMSVNIRRPDAEDDEDLKRFAQPVQAQFYPAEKDEQWWVILGRPKLNKLLAIKKVTNFKAVAETQVKLNFVVKAEGGDQSKIDYKVYLICDSYIGCDQEDEVSIQLV